MWNISMPSMYCEISRDKGWGKFSWRFIAEKFDITTQSYTIQPQEVGLGEVCDSPTSKAIFLPSFSSTFILTLCCQKKLDINKTQNSGIVSNLKKKSAELISWQDYDIIYINCNINWHLDITLKTHSHIRWVRIFGDFAIDSLQLEVTD